MPTRDHLLSHSAKGSRATYSCAVSACELVNLSSAAGHHSWDLPSSTEFQPLEPEEPVMILAG